MANVEKKKHSISRELGRDEVALWRMQKREGVFGRTSLCSMRAAIEREEKRRRTKLTLLSMAGPAE